MIRELAHYGRFLNDIKSRIHQAQTRASLSVNAEMILMYWDIGRIISEWQDTEGWGAKVIPKLSKDLRNELPEVKGFSERNIGRMIAFFHEYPVIAHIKDDTSYLHNTAEDGFLPQAVAKLVLRKEKEGLLYLLPLIPWGHHTVLMEQVKDIAIRTWYMRQTISNGWSRNILSLMISGDAYGRQGKAVSNFRSALALPQSDLAQQALKDPYVFDFLTIAEPFRERELETGLIQHLQRFLVELGQGFAFVGRQYHLDIGEEDFYIDLLFYHLDLRCFIVIDLKRGDFKPEYAGKMNFYCSAVDDILKHPTDQPTIGLILCQKKNKVVAEYSLNGLKKPIGVSEFELTRALPKELKSSLPSIEELEAELNEMIRMGKRNPKGGQT